MQSKAFMDSQFQTLRIQMRDETGSLDRVISTLRRRQLPLHSIAAGPSGRPGMMQITLILKGNAETARLARANLNKIATVQEIQQLSSLDYLDLWHLWAHERHLAS